VPIVKRTTGEVVIKIRGKKRLSQPKENWHNQFSTSNREKNLELSEIICVFSVPNWDQYRYVYRNLL